MAVLWNVGGGIKHFEHLVNLNTENKTFYDTPHNFFNSVFDSTFGLRWNGGRICEPADSRPMEDIMDIIKTYNTMNIGFNFTFSNRLLTKEHLDDEICNFILQALSISGSKKMNGVILASEILRDYIHENYPDVKIIWSVCNGINKEDAYNKETNNPINDMVVLHPDFNHDLEFLNKLENKDRLEVMANDLCVFGCPFRAKHYNELSQYALYQADHPIVFSNKELDKNRTGECEALQHGMNRDFRNVLTFSDIANLEKLGFKHFKIIGREHEWDYYYENFLQPNLIQYWIRNIIKQANQNCHI